MKKYALLALLLCLALCLPALAAAEGETKPKIDVVWLIDTTGSIGSSRISAIKNQMDSFAAQLTDFDVRYSLVAFGDEANNRKGFDFPENTVWLTMGSSHWTNSCETLKSYIEQGDGKLPTYDGGDTPETSTNAIVRAARWIGNATDSETWRDGALRQFVLATDAEPKKTGTYTVQGKSVKVYSMQEAIDACLQRNISVSVASFYDSTRIENAYKDLVEKTDGTYQYVGDSTFESLAKWIHDTPVVITQPEDLYVHEGYGLYVKSATLAGKKILCDLYCVKDGSTLPIVVNVPFQRADGIVSLPFMPVEKMDGEYFFRFTNRATGDTRSVETRHATLFVASEFAITGQPQDVTTEDGKTATFTVVATGDDLTYQWQKNVNGTWTNLSGETAATLSIPATLADDGSVYRCVVKDAISDKQPGGYTLTSESATLTVVAAPAITGQPQDVTTEAGKTAVFTVTATGNKLTYQWQQQTEGGWADLSGETGTTLTVSATEESSGSVYRCQVTSGYGTVLTSRSAALTVQSAPAIAQQPESVIVMEGEDASITVAATGTGLKYQWQVYRSGVWMDCIGEESPTLTLSGVTLADDGLTYRCVITSSFGTKVTSDAVTLTVLAKPEPPQTGDAFRPLLWLTLLGASLLGMVMLRRKRA